MPRLGILLALTEAEMLRFLECSSANEILSAVDQLEKAWNESMLQELGTAWNAIDLCLGGEKKRADVTSALGKCICGGLQLYEDTEKHIVSLKTAQEVRKIHDQLKPLDEEWLETKYFSLKTYDVDDVDFVNTLEYFELVKDFYRLASDKGWSVLFSVNL